MPSDSTRRGFNTPACPLQQRFLWKEAPVGSPSSSVLGIVRSVGHRKTGRCDGVMCMRFEASG